MDETGRRIAQAVNQAFRNRYQKYLEVCPKNAGITKQIQEQKRLTDSYFDLLQSIPEPFLLHQEFQSIIYRYTGLDEIDAMIFTRAIAEAYKKLGLDAL